MGDSFPFGNQGAWAIKMGKDDRDSRGVDLALLGGVTGNRVDFTSHTRLRVWKGTFSKSTFPAGLEPLLNSTTCHNLQFTDRILRMGLMERPTQDGVGQVSGDASALGH